MKVKPNPLIAELFGQNTDYGGQLVFELYKSLRSTGARCESFADVSKNDIAKKLGGDRERLRVVDVLTEFVKGL